MFEKVAAPASGWVHHAAAPADTMLNMHIGLKHEDSKSLELKLLDISNPASPNYGKWLSQEEVEQHTAPKGNATYVVKQWLVMYNITESDIRQPSPDWISFDIPVQKAESLLKTKYQLFKAEGHRVAPGALEYSVPKQLHGLIDTIQPTTAFHHRARPKIGTASHVNLPKRAMGKACPDDVTADCIKAYYNVDYEAKGTQELAVTGFLGSSAGHTDATAFLNKFFPKGNGSDFKELSIGSNVRPNNESAATLEGNLDTQIALSIGFPSPVTYLMVGPNDQDKPEEHFGDELISFGQWLNTAEKPPTVIASSYVGNEPDFEDSYKERICNEFMKAGARGITLLFSSGDFGVSGAFHEDSCPSGYNPGFPASCPYVTAVGATQFVGESEAAALFERDGATGGGFSRFYDVPSYQAPDTARYIAGLPPQSSGNGTSGNGTFSATGRGIPDISLVGINWDIIFKGELARTFGTSAAAPAVGSLISLINDYRQTLGKGPVGFINPALYGDEKVRAALRDVVGGSSRGCGGDGFPATEGWDAATGLGSLDFAALRAAFGNL